MKTHGGSGAKKAPAAKRAWGSNGNAPRLFFNGCLSIKSQAYPISISLINGWAVRESSEGFNEKPRRGSWRITNTTLQASENDSWRHCRCGRLKVYFIEIYVLKITLSSASKVVQLYANVPFRLATEMSTLPS